MTTSSPAGHRTVRLGVASVPTFAPESLHDLAVATETAGLDDLWVWEDCFKQSGLASATAVLAWTERLRVGIGLLPVPLRSTAVTAMEIATLARMFPHRFVPAVGHGVQSWMAQSGVRVDSPLALLREHTTALRRLLDGEEVTTSGRYVHLDAVRLDWPPAERLPLWVGGVGPKTVAAAGELGDGLILANALTPDEVGSAATVAGAAAQAAGRSLTEVHANLIATTGDRAQERLDAELPQWGVEPGRGIGAAGDAATIAAGVRRLAAAGATTVTIQPAADEPDLAAFVGFLGSEVKPLLADA